MARKYDDLYKPQSEWERIPGGYKRQRKDGAVEYQPRQFTLPQWGNLSPTMVQIVVALVIGGVIMIMALAILVVILFLPSFRIG